MNEKSHSRDHKTEDHGEGVQPEGHFQAETALMPDGEYPLIQRLGTETRNEMNMLAQPIK
jgi:hypothetical protein